VKQSPFKFLIGGFLALLLLAGGSAKEWIHACADHTDTVHGHRTDGQLAFDSQHHHCDFLSYCFPPFIPAAPAPPVFHYQPASYLVHGATLTEKKVQSDLFEYFGRGPPVSPIAA
jgi:hypothetical protein